MSQYSFNSKLDLNKIELTIKNIQDQFERKELPNLLKNLDQESYSHEIQELSCIESGEELLLQKALNTAIEKEQENLTKENCELNLALAARAAIKGGLAIETTSQILELYLEQLNKEFENPQNEEILTLIQTAKIHFSRLVRKLKQETPENTVSITERYVDRAKNYISKHIEEKINTSHIAQNLKLNSSYLSDLFHKTEGITLSRYILQEKITQAKNLLLYTDLSFDQIAEKLAMTSQSHLGMEFKKQTGMTLAQFRNNFKE